MGETCVTVRYTPHCITRASVRRTVFQRCEQTHDISDVSTCGRQAGDASGTGLFDTAARRFDEGRMHSIDPSLPEFFPELVGPNEVTSLSRQLRPLSAWVHIIELAPPSCWFAELAADAGLAEMPLGVVLQSLITTCLPWHLTEYQLASAKKL